MDIRGQEDLDTIRLYIHPSLYCEVRVFDVGDRNSFAEVVRNAYYWKVAKVLVGCEGEAGRQVQWSEAQTWARSHCAPYFEVSTMRQTYSEVIFREAARLALHSKSRH